MYIHILIITVIALTIKLLALKSEFDAKLIAAIKTNEAKMNADIKHELSLIDAKLVQMNSDILIAFVKSNGSDLQYIKNQTNEIMMAAIDSKYGHDCYQFVTDKTNTTIAEYAVNRNIDNIYLAKNLTDEFLIEKINQNELSLKKIKALTLNVYNQISADKKKYFAIIMHVINNDKKYYTNEAHHKFIFNKATNTNFCNLLLTRILNNSKINAKNYIVLFNFEIKPGYDIKYYLRYNNYNLLIYIRISDNNIVTFNDVKVKSFTKNYAENISLIELD